MMITFCASKMVIALVTIFALTSPSKTLVAVSILQVIVDLAVLIALGDLIVFHIYLAYQGISTYEYIQNQRSVEASRRILTTTHNTEMADGTCQVSSKQQDKAASGGGMRDHLSDAIGNVDTEFRGLMSTNRGAAASGGPPNRSGQYLNKEDLGSTILKRAGVAASTPFGPKSNHEAAVTYQVSQHQRSNATAPSHPIKLLIGKGAEDEDDVEPDNPISFTDCKPAVVLPTPESKTCKSEESLDDGLGDMSHDYQHNIFTAISGGGFNGILGVQNHKPVLKTAIDTQTPLRLSEVQEFEPENRIEQASEGLLAQKEPQHSALLESESLEAKEDLLEPPNKKDPNNLESFYDSQMEASCNRERSYQKEQDSIPNQEAHPSEKELKTQANPFSRRTRRSAEEDESLPKEHSVLQKVSANAREVTLEGPSNSTGAEPES